MIAVVSASLSAALIAHGGYHGVATRATTSMASNSPRVASQSGPDNIRVDGTSTGPGNIRIDERKLATYEVIRDIWFDSPGTARSVL